MIYSFQLKAIQHSAPIYEPNVARIGFFHACVCLNVSFNLDVQTEIPGEYDWAVIILVFIHESYITHFLIALLPK